MLSLLLFSKQPCKCGTVRALTGTEHLLGLRRVAYGIIQGVCFKKEASH